MQVSIRELKAHFSHYIKQAQAGQNFEITSHRKIVARITGIPAAQPDQEAFAEGLNRLLASGAATWSGGKPKGANLQLAPKGKPISQMILEDRG